ncbi:MAG: methylenetetrahydrofolate reductase [NAD(P)H] [Candidatus Hydrogenedentales bacterium]
MSLAQIYRENPFVLSYELFPPKTDKGMEALRRNLAELLQYHPHFITCTYGAGGSTRDKTLETLQLVREMTDVPLASHLTCVGATTEELRQYLGKAFDCGIGMIVAIRGDAPKADVPKADVPKADVSKSEVNDTFSEVAGGLRYGNELVSLIRSQYPDFGIAVGGYPEKHPEALSPEVDLENLKRKVDAGADVVITQLFYDNADFYRWRDRCAAAGITVPIVPGVMPIINYKQIQKITSMCGARMPKTLTDPLDACGDDDECQFEVGVQHAINQVNDLLKHGIPGIHFYVLNQARATTRVLDAVDLPMHKATAK